MAKRKYQRRSRMLDPSLSNGIISILLLVLGAIVTLSFFDRAGTIGIILNEWVLAFLFGSIRFITPVVLIAFAWFLIKDMEYNYRQTHGIGAIILFLSLSSLFHLSFPANDMWRQALEGNGGGVFGMLAWPLKSYLGTIASWILLLGLTIVSLLLLFNTAITHFLVLHKKFFTGLGWTGQMLVRTVSTLFIKTGSAGYQKDEFDDEEDEEYYDEEEDDEEDHTEEEEVPRGFRKRTVGSDDEEFDDEPTADEEDSDDEDAEPAGEIPTRVGNKEKNQDPNQLPTWAQTAVVKPLPTAKLLKSKKSKPTSGDIKANQEIIRDTLAEFRIDVTMGDVQVGPTVTQFTLKPSKGVKLTRITSLSNDLALALAAHPIRIEAPIPGKALVGIEVPNEKTAMVTFKELIQSKEFSSRKNNLSIALGKDVAGKVWFGDLPRMPHLLIAGATGSGKTVCVNTIIMSLLYENTAEDLRMIMVDPKRVELTLYNGIPHLLTPVITNTQKTVNALKWTISEMERRFELLSQVASRNIDSYNERHPQTKLPHIVFVIDELADLMATAANEVEAGIIRLAQMARAVGIHLIVATQRPSVDVITGLMKANIPARIAFSVASLIDSRTILDCPGAEKLIGRGDMLFQTAELSKPVRIQGAFISEEELKNVVKYLKGGKKVTYDESIVDKPTGKGTASMFGGASDDQDELFHEAKEVILDAGKASASFLQRRLKVGYARAARILDELEDAGIIGPSDGAKPREILMTEREIEDSSMGMGQELNVFDDDQGDDEIEEEDDDSLEDEEEELDEEDEDAESADDVPTTVGNDENLNDEEEDEEFDDEEEEKT